MFQDFTKGRYRALELVAEHVKEPSRELRLNAIVSDITDEDLSWVTERVHYFLLKLLEDIEYDPAEDNEEFLHHIGLLDEAECQI